MLNGTTSHIPPAVSETPPTEPTRADKRLIFAKLEEVYVDESAGYKTPWTDAAVAKDLGVPMAWVASVREENFGPANDNGEIRDMLARVKAASSEAMKVLAEAKSIRAEGKSILDRVNASISAAVDIGKKLDGLTAIAERIERSLKP